MRHRGSAAVLFVAALATTRELGAQLGSTAVYTAIPPCRIVDTRFAPSGAPLAANVTRAIHVVGSASLAGQGGSASGCGIPGYGGLPTPSHPRVQAVMMNFIAVAPAGAGHLLAWASDAPPNASVLNYRAGITIANGVVVPLDQDATPGADLLVRAEVAATHLVIDVLGYFSDRHPLAGEGRPGAAVKGWAIDVETSMAQLCTGPTGVSFGLSRDGVRSADSPAVCEAGFWVCSLAERGTAPCDTQREDTTCDAEACGTCADLATNDHYGWLADNGAVVGTLASISESGQGFAAGDCWSMPVWCCTWR